MNAATRRTRACTLETLDEELKAAIRAHGEHYDLPDLEDRILMCCETITFHQKKGLLGGIRTTLSAVYVTPKWLVWAESSGPSDVQAGTALLSQVDMGESRVPSQYAITPNQGLNITARYTDRSRSGTTFIVLDTLAGGQQFRRILDEAIRNASKEFRSYMI